MEVNMEDVDRKEIPDRVSSVKDHEPLASADTGYDKGYHDGYTAGMKDTAVKHAVAMEVAEAEHEKALKALTSKHAKALQTARGTAADIMDEADVAADTARLVTVREVLALLDDRIDRGHADGRLAVMEVRNVIATAFGDV